MRRLLLSLLCLALFSACRNAPAEAPAEATAEQLAGAAAEQYYRYLLQGNLDAFVDGTYRPQRLRPEHRAELVDNTKMFLAQIAEQHRGLQAVELLSAHAVPAHHSATAILLLTFADATTEQVAVPMVESAGLWYMR